MNIKKIEAEIRRLVPRLQELSFGCEVIPKFIISPDDLGLDKKHRLSDTIIKGAKKIKVLNYIRDLGHEYEDGSTGGAFSSLQMQFTNSVGERSNRYMVCGFSDGVLKNTEVIGHPVNLEAVLEAVRIVRDNIEYRKLIAGGANNLTSIISNWNIDRGLSGQSEDLISLVGDLIYLFDK